MIKQRLSIQSYFTLELLQKWINVSALRSDANLDVPTATTFLALCYYTGDVALNIPENIPTCVSWARRAIEHGDCPIAKTILALQTFNNTLSETNPQEKFKVAANLLLDAAYAGFDEAQYLVGHFHMRGQFFPQDEKIGFKWLDRAAMQEHGEAILSIASCYYNGIGVEANALKSFIHAKKAADAGNDVQSSSFLGMCFYNGRGCQSNHLLAYQLFSKAAEKGDAYGTYWSGICLVLGHGVEKNFTLAYQAFVKAAEMQYIPAVANLKQCYFFGIGCDIDLVKASEMDSMMEGIQLDPRSTEYMQVEI